MLNFIALGLVGYLVHGPLMEAAGIYPQSDAIAGGGAPAAALRRRLSRARRTADRARRGGRRGTPAVSHRARLRDARRRDSTSSPRGSPACARPARCCAPWRSAARSPAWPAASRSAPSPSALRQFSPGYGFTAIAVALLGRLHPLGVVLAALLFGALDAGSTAMQRVAGVSSVLVSVIQATSSSPCWRGVAHPPRPRTTEDRLHER